MAITVHIFDRADPRLGRHVEHDSRSRNFPVTTPPPKKLQTVYWGDSAPVLDQGNLGGCVGWTGADILNTELYGSVRQAKNNGQSYTDKDGLTFYEAATHADNIPGAYPPVDSGSTGLGLAKALKKLGLIDRYTHAFTWAQFLASMAVGPVALGTLWTNRMFNPDRNGVVHVGALSNSTIAGGHEYMCRGINVEKSLALCRNHWRPSWNPKALGPKLPGEFWLPVPDLKTLLANQGDVTVLHGVGMP